MRRTLIFLLVAALTLGSNALAQRVGELNANDSANKLARAAAMEEYDRLVRRRDSLRTVLDGDERQRNATTAEEEESISGADTDEQSTNASDTSSAAAAFRLFTQPDFEEALRKSEATKQETSSTNSLFSNSLALSSGIPDVKSVTVGNQTWTAENLNTDRFRNGDPIPEAKSVEEWTAAHRARKPAWCYYNNDPAQGDTYGRLYNWFAVVDPRGLAPAGWHVPTEYEWEILNKHLGSGLEAGAKLRSTTGDWQTSATTPNTNESGFGGLPGSCRGYEASFLEQSKNGYWWTSTPFDMGGEATTGYGINIGWGGIVGKNIYMAWGLSVRCVKD